jgi:hypothetical protein
LISLRSLEKRKPQKGVKKHAEKRDAEEKKG